MGIVGSIEKEKGLIALLLDNWARLLSHFPWASANRFGVIGGSRGKNDIKVEHGIGRHVKFTNAGRAVAVLAQSHWQTDGIVKALIVVKGVLKAVLPISMIV